MLDMGELNCVVLCLTHRFRRAEIPLLADDLSIRSPAPRWPPQYELLRALDVGFLKLQPDPSQFLRFVEHQPNGLRSRPRRTPAMFLVLEQCGFNRMGSVSGY